MLTGDLITDQEMAFARLVLSGGMTDRQAAEAVGLNPDSAAYIKSKPTVRDYMLQHRAAVQQQVVQQEADLSRRAVERLHRLKLDREQVLNRLWEIANLSPEMTRGSITGQVKALFIIVAMENFIPNRLAVSSEKKPAPAPAQIHAAALPTLPQATTIDLQPSPAPPVPPCRGACRGAQEGNSLGVPACPGSVGAPPNPGRSHSTFANRFTPSEAAEPHLSLFVPEMRAPFSIRRNNPFVHPLSPQS